MSFIQQNYDRHKMLACETETAGCQALLGDRLLFQPKHSCLRKHIQSPYLGSKAVPRKHATGNRYIQHVNMSNLYHKNFANGQLANVAKVRPLQSQSTIHPLFHLSYSTRHHPICSSQARNLARSRGPVPSVLPSHLPRMVQQVL